MKTIDQTIKEAIYNKQQIHAIYAGKNRKFCPHQIGEKSGKTHCLFLQFGGESTSGLGNPENNWRCIDVSLLSNVKVVEGQWYTASNHANKNSCVDSPECTVNF
ncbi:hypothetical protein COB57_03135 [Candidatus Peregrinibacteria bacterium]|nr:MAG: hypothetical protein COB57_03135 [Candidatus Peregrinibacteria bacterium]